MRYEKSVTAISWIPSDAITGMPKLPFELGIGHYDEPPPDSLAPGDLASSGGGLVGSTTFKVGPRAVVVPGVAFETLRDDSEANSEKVRFLQTVGGRAGFPAPRRVSGKPFFRINSATAWTTLALTIKADGYSEGELIGASPFPRHWVYDKDNKLVQKSGTIDFEEWYRKAHGGNTPW